MSKRVQFIIQGKAVEIDVDEGRTLLDAALMARLSPPYSCMEGTCGSCEAYIESGKTT
ncbi:MAG: 2Fe-2S iron-sulfur cluster binding domain-containing protein, partial [Bdellovibrio sp.]